jgi:hypothetical protein
VIPRLTFPEKKLKVKLRDGFLRKLKREGTRFLFKRGRLERKKPMKKVSRSQRNKLKIYFAVRDAFLAREENGDCICCKLRRERGENIRQQPATECHHKRGRCGSLISDERFFAATCYDCGRNWIHQHPEQSRDMGLLAPPHLWNVPAN